MLSHSAILLLIISGPVRARVKCQRINTVLAQKGFQDDADGETFPLTATADNLAIGSEQEFEGKNFKLPEKFHPENDRDADPVEEKKKKTKKKSKPSARKFIAEIVSFPDKKGKSTINSAKDLSAFNSKDTTLKKEKKTKLKNFEEEETFKTEKKNPSNEKPENLELENEEGYNPEQPEPEHQKLTVLKKLKAWKFKMKKPSVEKPEEFKEKIKEKDNSGYIVQNWQIVDTSGKERETESITIKQPTTEEREHFEKKVRRKLSVEGPEREVQVQMHFGTVKETKGTIREEPTTEKPRNFGDVSLQQKHEEPQGPEESENFKLAYDIELSPGKGRVLTLKVILNDLMKNLRETKISVLM